MTVAELADDSEPDALEQCRSKVACGSSSHSRKVMQDASQLRTPAHEMLTALNVLDEFMCRPF